MKQGANAEENVPGELRLLAGESTREVVGGDVLVHRVCLDVLVVELGRVRTLAESPKALRVAAIRSRRRDLEAGQMADERAAPAPSKPEQRDQVDGGQARRREQAGRRADRH